MTKSIGVGLIGNGFMGRAHANAWGAVNRFFTVKRHARMKTVAGLSEKRVGEFAARWGFDESTIDWRSMLEDDEIGLIDVTTENNKHAEMSVAALESGRNVCCEKPMAGTLEEARAMRNAARKASRRGLHAWVWFNYRRCPAVAFAHQLVKRGKLGRIFHVRAQYLQDWGGPDTPLLWRFIGKHAGSGAHGDLNAHIIDMARFVTGDELTEVTGAIEETFIKERRLVEGVGGPISGKGASRGKRMGRSTVDDCLMFMGRMKQGAVASFEATRLATGNQNANRLEINGEKGSLRFDFERMNALEWWDNTIDPGLRGWSRIMCTDADTHPYVENYWPAAHLIGYEHCFTSMCSDILRVLAGNKPVVPLPDFEDAYQTQRVLHAALLSAREKRPVKMSEVK
ncbi:MAG: dehydrogenase [Phycisphaerae bacterium]|nr:dehydrogenase [Phycisphaerae bacterium]HAW94856.1 dehydrogenase [Phycisphaerales bacterium]